MQVPSWLNEHYIVGVTGHIDISETDPNLLRQTEEILKNLQTKHENLALLCSGAKGADTLVANVAAGLKIPIIGFQLVDYQCDQATQEEFENNQHWLDSLATRPEFKKFNAGNQHFKDKFADCKKIADEQKREAKTREVILEIHREVAAITAGNSDYLIALWDGVDNGRTGGTSETVHMALNKKDFTGKPVAFQKAKKGVFDQKDYDYWKTIWHKPKGYLYHIVTPREKNPFAVGRFTTHVGKAVPNASIYETGISPFPAVPYLGSGWQRTWRNLKVRFIYNGIFLYYFLPALFALITVISGSAGFRDLRHFEEWRTATLDSIASPKKRLDSEARLSSNQMQSLNDSLAKSYQWQYKTDEEWPHTNDLFNAINLITFNASIIPEDKVPAALSFARATGLAFILNAFIIAFFFAIGRNDSVRLKAKFLRFFNLDFYVLAGLNEKTLSLAKDVKLRGKSVIIVDSEPDFNKITEAEANGISVYKANSYSSAALLKVEAVHAKKVFFMSEDDVINIRSLQELVQLRSSRSAALARKQDQYIHLDYSRYKDFVCKMNPDTPISTTHVFNIYENTARRLLLRYPVLRLPSGATPQTAEIFVFGFGDMAQQIVLNLLRSGFYKPNQKLKITVFTLNHEEKELDFYKNYPALWHDADQNKIYEKKHSKEIRNDIFPDDILTFKELALSDAAYFSDDSIYKPIAKGNAVSMYFCLTQPMQSAAYLHAILPKIKHLQTLESSEKVWCDVKFYCYFDINDRDEIAHLEHTLNSKIPNSPVIFFGSSFDECTEHAITGRSEELLPKLINVWYDNDSIFTKAGVRKEKPELDEERYNFWVRSLKKDDKGRSALMEQADYRWSTLSITQKESNRFAADHLWVKLHMMDHTFLRVIEDMTDEKQLNKLTERFSALPDADLFVPLNAIAAVEHRRWCAEKLLEGFLPIQDMDENFANEKVRYVKKWNVNKQFKNYYQEQKLHIDLVPYANLFSGKIDENLYEPSQREYFDERSKDVSLIEAIPYLLYALNKNA